MPKKIPYAVANYEEIVRDNYFFVDKTRFIRELENYKLPVFLRPRRFGKSLWCSVMECYYDVNRKERFDALFGNTDIGRAPTESHNSHLVLRLDFSKVQPAETVAKLESNFDLICRMAFELFLSRYHAYFGDFMPPKTESAANQLALMLKEVEQRGTPLVNIIIDEYDNFTNQLLTTHRDALYMEVTTGDSFLRGFFKTIKAGVGEDTVARVFITGVLPVTMDDLTSGFNIGQIITLERGTLSMMGFTQAEVDTYVDAVFAERPWGQDAELRNRVRDDLRSHYNGYRLLPDASDTLYNSTILNYYLNSLVLNHGEIPRETIDNNLRTDINWLRRLTGSEEETRKLLEQLQFDGTLPVDMAMLTVAFNRDQFVRPAFYPLSLLYLGMVTFQDEFTLVFPNLTTKAIFTEYFNEIENITVSLGFTDIFRQYLTDHDLSALFAGYWQRYISQIPAQTFDQANENFFRSTFYELCTRYLSRHFYFAAEMNHPSGRSDWEAVGRPGSAFVKQALLLEFKHFPRAKGERLGVADWTEPPAEMVAQLDRYAADLTARYPGLTVRRHVVCTIGCATFKFFTLD